MRLAEKDPLGGGEAPADKMEWGKEWWRGHAGTYAADDRTQLIQWVGDEDQS